MKLEHELQHAYQEETRQWTIRAEARDNMLKSLQQQRESRPNRKRANWLVAVVVAVVLIIPSGAYAGYTYLADYIYGSEKNITAIGGTTSDYQRLEAKLRVAQEQLSSEEFAAFMEVLLEFGKFALTHADLRGQLHPEDWSIEDQQVYNQLAEQLEPYFDKLSNAEAQQAIIAEERIWQETLEQAKQQFSSEDYAEFTSLFTQMKQYEAIVVDQDKSFHEDRLSPEQKQELKQLRERITPYLQQLGMQ